MYDTLASVCFFMFLLFSPGLLLLRFLISRPAWWLIVVAIVMVGWGLVIGTYLFNQLHISDLIDQGRDHELPPGWDGDGAAGLFAFFGGWLISLVYFLFWLSLYGIAGLVKRLVRSRQSPTAGNYSN